MKDNFEEVLMTDLKKRLDQTDSQTEKFTFFWENKSPFSQWHKCSFTSRAIDFHRNGLPEPLSGELNFSSAEQFMMLHKAVLFNDYDSANNILLTNNVSEQKRMGRLIKNFDDLQWIKFRAAIVYEGNKQKFTQNAQLNNELLLTQGTSLVEAAPNDNIWGIGLPKDNTKALKRATWRGTNLLGEILTYIRIEITGRY